MPTQPITNFLQTYRQGRLVITNRVSYNVRDLIEEIVRLRHAQFVDPNFADGTPKTFYNVGWALSDNIFKHTVIGTKDIQMHSTNRNGSRIVPLIKMGVRDYLKNTFFGEIVDDCRKELIDMGHVVTKIVNGKPYAVDLLNLIVPPNAKSLQDTSFVEQITMTWEDMLQRKEQFKENWSEIETLWNYMQSSGRSYFTVYEYWCRDEFDGAGKGYFKGCKVYLDRSYIPEDMVNDPSLWSPYLELDSYKSADTITIRSKKRQKDLGMKEELVYPYVEKRLFKLNGRWMGLGIYELVRGILEHINRNWNLKAKFDELQYRGIMIHKQPSMGAERTLTQEFLESIPSGGVIDVVADEDLRRLDLGTITYDALSTNDALLQLTKLILGVAENIAGTDIKSNVTASAIQANVNLSETTYGIVVRQMSFLLREMFQDYLMKEIVSELSAEAGIQISGDPKEFLDVENVLVDQYVNTKISEAMKLGMFVTEEMADQLRSVITKELQSTNNLRWIQISQKMVDMIDPSIEFYIDGENFDAKAKMDMLNQMLTRDTLTMNREEMEKELTELMGLDSKKLAKTEQQKQQEIQMQLMQQEQDTKMPKP